jgi:hypothetical protein
MKKLRVYADTSVFGGCFDPEFAVESRQLFEEVRRGRFVLVVSDTLVAELEAAPPEVRRLLEELGKDRTESVGVTAEAEALRDAYLAAGVVGRASIEDAEHIAIASVAAVDLIVSWNFRHIVHFEKIAGYNAVNLLQGYPAMRIFSPKEVVQP